MATQLTELVMWSGFGGQQQTLGTGNPPFTQTVEQDANQQVKYQSITKMPAYEANSFEELRWEDYSKGNKGNQNLSSATNRRTFRVKGFKARSNGGDDDEMALSTNENPTKTPIYLDTSIID